MEFKKKLQKGILLKRYKRFFADIAYEGKTITAHLPNTGSLKSVPLMDTACYFSLSDDPKRKLKYTLEFIETPTGLAGVNTRTPNTVVKEYLETLPIPGFTQVQSEVKISDKTRIDFVLHNKKSKLKFPDYLNEDSKDFHFIEVKNITLAEGNTCYFPDGVTERGTKHLLELIELQKKGYSTQIIFTIQRENVTTFSPAKSIDPVYAKTLTEAQAAGVKISAYLVNMDKKKVFLNTKDLVKIHLNTHPRK